MTPPRNPANDAAFPKNDRGSGTLNDYKFDFIPRNARTRIQLAGSDPYQDELRSALEENGPAVHTAGGQRTVEEERTDAPMELRLFLGRRVSGVVGTVPRGLEPAVVEALSRLEHANKPLRIPAEIVTTRRGLRVELLMGETRDV
jgi:hypothetical protein